MNTTLATFALFAILLLILAWMSRQVGLLTQEIVYRITGSADLAMVVLFLLYLPGILIHEMSHWLMAKILGLKTGKFRVWPRKKGQHIGMGSVSVSSGGAVVDSLVGLAPLIVGSALVAMVGSQVFQGNMLPTVWQGGDWWPNTQAWISTIARQQDGFLWSYLLFTVANAMLPSSSDREPLRSLLLYIVVFGVLYILIDSSGQFFMQAATWLAGPVGTLVNALLLVTLIDVVVLACLFLLRTMLVILRPQ
ncbi:MAG: hypothetical protein R2856_16350 [Caldilineaceae bacterium]